MRGKWSVISFFIFNLVYFFSHNNLQALMFVKTLAAAEGPKSENLVPLREEMRREISNIEKTIEELDRRFSKLEKESQYTPELKQGIESLQKNLPIIDQKIRDLASEEFRISGVLMQAAITTIVILVAVMSGIGLVTYKMIYSSLQTQVEKKVDERANYFLSRLYTYLSFIHWREYEILRRESELQPICIDIAIDDAERALGVASRLDPKKHDYEILICSAKNHLAYHLAARKRDEEDRRRASQFGREVYETSRKYEGAIDCDWYRWRETYVWVIMRLSGDNAETRDEAKHILSALLKRDDIPQLWRDPTRQKYKTQFGLET